MIKVFSTDHLNEIFAADNKYEGVRNLMFDVTLGKELYNADGEKIPAEKAEETLRNIAFEIFGVNENSSKRDIKRAIKKHRDEYFEVIEDAVDLKVDKGFHESEWFNEFVEMKNIKAGDRNEFWTEDKTILSVAKVAGDMHDLVLQRLGSGKTYSVLTSVYAVAIGADLELYLMGRENWAKMIEKIAEAFIRHIQNEVYAQVMGVGSVVPVPDVFHGNGVLDSTTKDAFDQLIEDISSANQSDVYIIGTKTALKKLNGLSDVTWRSAEAKADVYRTGRLGQYEGTYLMEIPQRFDVSETFEGSTLSRLVRNDRLLIMPVAGDKFVKFVDVGETIITEKTQRGARVDDVISYEVQREMGVGVQLGKYFGVWDIATN